MRARAVIAFFVALSAGAGAAGAQELSMNLESREQYAGLPFVVSLAAEGFENGQPPAPELPIDGCETEHFDTGQEVKTFVDLNRRKRVRRVIYRYRYRVTCPAGRYRVPSVTLEHQGQKATAGGGRIQVQDIGTSADMKLRTEVPDRAVWVGETFDMHLDWLLRRDVEDQTFSVPMFDMEETFQVSVPETGGGRGLPFEIGGKEVQLPVERSRVTIDGREFVRLRLTAGVTPLRAGALEIPPAQVVAALKVGTGRDRFGFRSARTKLFKAVSEPVTYEVNPLPLQGRPPSFNGAVGSKFSLEASASRSVVRLGEPIALSLRVRADRNLEGLSPPKLEPVLPEQKFSVVDAPATGDLSDDGREKTFQVTVQIQSTDVRKIPALPFSYFDPESGTYHTVKTEPIALSVEGSAIVGADEVVGAGSDDGRGGDGGPSAPPSMVGADLALSDTDETLDGVVSAGAARPLVIGLYLVPLMVLGIRLWQLRTRGRRDVAGEVKSAHRAVRSELERARSAAARDAAPAVANALRGLARTAGVERGRGDDDDVIERLETEAFAPDAGDQPVPEELRRRAAELADRWLAEGRKRRAGAGARGGRSAAVALVIGAGLAAYGGVARADSGAELERARELYREALAADDRDARTRGFARAAATFGDVVEARPGRPALLVDWGNAALGAGDLGRAALAYRRALALDPDDARARKNLAWVRERLPDWVPRPEARGAVDSLFFWHHRMTAAEKHLAAAFAFAVTVLLLVPWARRRLWLRRLAIVPAALWIAMLASALLHPDVSGDAVVVADSATLRSADSTGAPAALARPLPAGAEVALRETREPWARVELADGTTGWVSGSAVARVEP